MLQEMAEFSLTVGKSSSLLSSFLPTGALVKIRTQCGTSWEGRKNRRNPDAASYIHGWHSSFLLFSSTRGSQRLDSLSPPLPHIGLQDSISYLVQSCNPMICGRS